MGTRCEFDPPVISDVGWESEAIPLRVYKGPILFTCFQHAEIISQLSKKMTRSERIELSLAA